MRFRRSRRRGGSFRGRRRGGYGRKRMRRGRRSFAPRRLGFRM